MGTLAEVQPLGIPVGVIAEFVVGGSIAQAAGSLAASLTGFPLADPAAKIALSAGAGYAAQSFKDKGKMGMAELARATAVSSGLLAVYDLLPVVGYIDEGIKSLLAPAAAKPKAVAETSTQVKAAIQESTPSTAGLTKYERAVMGSM